MVQDTAKRGLDIGITIALGLLGIIVLFLVSPDNLIINPTFEVSIEPHVKSEKVYVINTGWKQAKDVEIFIMSNEILSKKSINDSYCPEGFEILDSNEPMTLKLHLERMSVNLECSIYFSSESLKISKVIVTSDNQPIVIKEPPNPTLSLSKIPANMIYIIYAIFVIVAILSLLRLILFF